MIRDSKLYKRIGGIQCVDKVLDRYHFCVNWIKYHTIRYNKTGKVALCCIAKCENDYIREYVEHYLSIGVDTVFIYDNNDVDGETFDSVIGDYISSGLCVVNDVRGKKVCQWSSYAHCYNTYGKEYDWMMFFDCDEFLTITLPGKNVKSFLEMDIFKKYQMIHVNWMCYGDNDMLDNDGRKVTDRFINPILPYDFVYEYPDIPENNHVKTIVRCGLKNVMFSSHLCWNDYVKSCDVYGCETNIHSPFKPYIHDVAYLRHYQTKTIGEWVRIKQKRGYPDQTDEAAQKRLGLDFFFRINSDTIQKRDYAASLMI